MDFKKKTTVKSNYLEMIALLDLSEIQKKLLVSTWLDYLLFMIKKARNGWIDYNFCQLLIVLLSLIIPVLEGMQLKSISIGGVGSKGLTYVTILSLVIAICTALNRQLGFDSKWRHYRRNAEMMRNEGDDFLGLSGNYKSFTTHDEAIQTFISTVTSFKRQEVGNYLDGKNNSAEDEKNDKKK